MDRLADAIDWKACHSGREAAAALRHLRRNLIDVRIIAAISRSPGVAVYVGEVAISIIAVRWDIGSVVVVIRCAVRPEWVVVIIRP
jgi:hypothetical protein